MRVLITGGAGFIGSHFVKHFVDNKDEIVVIDNLRSGYEKNVAGLKIDFVNGSIEDEKLVNQVMHDVDYVFHLAALVSVVESMSNPKLTEEINVKGTINVLDAALKNKIKKVVFASSAAVYGDNPVIPKREEMLPEPKSPYAITKLAGEYYCQMYEKEFGLPTVILRFFNVFGPRQDPKSQYAAAVPIFIANAIQDKNITIYGNGEQTRDFVFVKDLVSAAVLALEKGSGVYNIAGGKTITVTELAKKIVQLTGSNSKIVYTTERPGDVKHSSADISRLLGFGYSSKYSLDDALQETINFFGQQKTA